MTEPKGSKFWATLPGLVTALAGVITAIAILVTTWRRPDFSVGSRGRTM